jgi:CheY-like chemotaxis protein
MFSRKPHILVVDDEPMLRIFAVDILIEEGFTVAEAENAKVALGVLEAQANIRVLFTDIQMPGAINGMELAHQVHARWPHILIMITSGRERPSVAEIPTQGHFLAKPYSPDELVRGVNELLRSA